MKKYHVYGLGNALLDREATVNDQLLVSLAMEKGAMTLIDEVTHQDLTTSLDGSFCHYGCGGSAANTLIALRQFGGRGFYSCKVADDEAGKLFLQGLTDLDIACNLTENTLPQGVTGQCLVLVTEDAQRTMYTHLGISETLCPEVLDLDAISNSEYLYLEGYLITSPTARKALIAAKLEARQAKTKVAFTLSDINMVRYFKQELLEVIGDGVDLLFCNEEEALQFTQASCFEAAINLLQPLATHLVVTCGSQGAILAIDGEIMAIPTTATKAVDTIGAGDMFAGAYLYAVTHGFAPSLAVELANKAATALVGKYGARLSDERIWTIKDQFMTVNYSFARGVFDTSTRQVDELLID